MTLNDIPPQKSKQTNKQTNKTRVKQQFLQQQETPKTLQNVHWPQVKPVTIRREKKKVLVVLHAKS